ncbi:MAG: single-stranded-DNA-specific exonuclease RecJ, partial [Pseudomonadota bacterium]
MTAAIPVTASPQDHLFGVSQSLGGRYWTLKGIEESATRALAAQLGGNDLLGRLLASRDVAPGEVQEFLSPTLRRTFPDPSSFADMDKAAQLTLDA